MDTEPLYRLPQLFMRACLFLLDGASAADEVSGSMITAMNELNSVALEHAGQVDEELWSQELGHLSERDDLNARLSGYACAVLMERNAISARQCAEEVSRRLSPAFQPIWEQDGLKAYRCGTGMLFSRG